MVPVKQLVVKRQSGTSRTLFATWEFHDSYSCGENKNSTTDHYDVTWSFDTGDCVWFTGSENQEKNKNSTYNVPENAERVKVTVTPVATRFEVNGTSYAYWLGIPTSVEYLMTNHPPQTPSAPSVVIEDYSLTATLNDIKDKNAEAIEFEVVNGDSKFNVGISPVKTQRAIFKCAIVAGGLYRVRCRAINYVGDKKVYGYWSSYSSEVQTIPLAPTNLKCYTESKTSVKLTWDAQPTSESYKIEYTTNKLYFDTSSEVKSLTVNTNTAFIKGLEAGHEWYFRVSATNKKGSSGWSNIVYKLVGTQPQPPTTWTLTSTAIIGDLVTLYWVHNTADGSKQLQAQVEVTINGITKIYTVDTPHTDPEEEEKIYTYKLDLSSYREGAHILWRIRTKGITEEYSEWSIQRTIDIYAPPVAVLNFNNNSDYVEKFPLPITVDVSPENQNALSYHLSIKSEYAHKSFDESGNSIFISAGQEIYSKVFTLENNHFAYNLMPNDLTFTNNQYYTFTVTVSMNSGLIATASQMFVVSWSDENYNPDAELAIDKNTLCAYIIPFCVDINDQIIPNIVMSVYRREFNGSFTEIAKDIPNNGHTSVTDPHPSLDFARYRIVARNTVNGNMGVSDLPGYPVKNPNVVIQWDEEWKNFDYKINATPETPPWTGSMLRIPYNIDISESYSTDSSLVKYIGRTSPVSYYGTQQNIGGTWNFVFPADDKETLYTLRRLAIWHGDVYVREPSGNGYPAHIKLSLSIKHKDVVIPVTMTVTKVEGEA